MSEITTLLILIATLSLGTMSPGPSFIFIAHVAVAASRRHALAAAIGMGVGGVLFAAAALVGLHTVFVVVPTLYVALKIAGGVYLIYLGTRIFLSARAPLTFGAADHAGAKRGGFLPGLITQISNPKTAIVYASVFAALLPQQFSLAFALAVIVAVFILEAGWYGLVAYGLSAEKPRRVYLSYRSVIDRLAGTALCALGVKLVVSAQRP